MASSQLPQEPGRAGLLPEQTQCSLPSLFYSGTIQELTQHGSSLGTLTLEQDRLGRGFRWHFAVATRSEAHCEVSAHH